MTFAIFVMVAICAWLLVDIREKLLDIIKEVRK